MTDHPAKTKSCSKKQIEAFEQIATGVTNPNVHTGTLNALSLKGLIAAEWEVVGRDRFGEVKIPRWFVPIPIHMQWCTWCSEQPDDESLPAA